MKGVVPGGSGAAAKDADGAGGEGFDPKQASVAEARAGKKAQGRLLRRTLRKQKRLLQRQAKGRAAAGGAVAGEPGAGATGAAREPKEAREEKAASFPTAEDRAPSDRCAGE